jgi:hypothetical protein
MNLGLHTVWKYYYLQGLHQSTDIGEVIINKTFWSKLPADIQEIVRTAAMASMTETYTFNVYRNAQAVVKLRNDFKVQILDTPKGFFPGVRASDERSARPLRGQGCLLQAGSGFAAQLRQNCRTVLDEDSRSLLQSRQCGAEICRDTGGKAGRQKIIYSTRYRARTAPRPRFVCIITPAANDA